jgi:hypothetical protein
MTEYWRAQTPEQLQSCFNFLRQCMPEQGLRIEWEPWKEKRSLSANNLYWQWLTVLAAHFSRGGKAFSKDDMHDLMRHQFLGYVEKTIGSTTLQPLLASTTELNVTQMCHYMTKIDAWSADHGCLLPHPADGEYSKYKEANQ